MVNVQTFIKFIAFLTYMQFWIFTFFLYQKKHKTHITELKFIEKFTSRQKKSTEQELIKQKPEKRFFGYFIISTFLFFSGKAMEEKKNLFSGTCSGKFKKIRYNAICWYL